MTLKPNQRSARFFSWLAEATQPADRWIMLFSALTLAAYAWSTTGQVGERAVILRDNQPLMTLQLNKNNLIDVEGRLGPIKIEVNKGRVRLLEYASPRMVGTRTGWIQHSGEIAVCVPCGILIQVQGGSSLMKTDNPLSLDGIAR
ncbi:MAG: NusG domain II-containing protein [Magnetococcales bacterium]|nr:NusG domain II-containing protein [Magnetococcales bacterium]